MKDQSYLQWLSRESGTAWWHDSGDPRELEHALAHGAVGATTNPVLCAQALKANRDAWREDIRQAIEGVQDARARAEALTRIVVRKAARVLEPVHSRTGGEHGYVCAQVDPSLAGDREAMEAMARRFSTWAPNVAIKLPATSAGLDVMEHIAADGTAVTVTMSFTVAQVCAVGSRYQALKRRQRGGRAPGRCFAVIMIGRQDDYLHEVCTDNRDALGEAEIRLAGLGVAKRAYALYRENGFDATLLVAALRGTHHLTGLTGAKLIVSIHPTWQKALLEGDFARTRGIDEPVPPEVLAKLAKVPEFAKAFDSEGLKEREMVSYGLTQRTLSQFIESGWKLLEQFTL